MPEKQRIGEIRAWVMTKKDRRESDAVLVIDIMRRKAVQLNAWFGTNRWTPHKTKDNDASLDVQAGLSRNSRGEGKERVRRKSG